MINSKKELRECLKIEWQRNMHTEHYSALVYFLSLYLLKRDGAFAFRLLKALRKYEYALNCRKGKSMLGTIEYLYRRLYYRRMCVKYNLTFSANAIEAGIYLPHVIGGVL